MTELQQLCHYNIANHENATKTLLHEFMVSRIQVCIDEIISGILPNHQIDQFGLSQMEFLFQTVVENQWVLTEFASALEPVMDLLTKYVRKNFAASTEIYILAERYNSLQELEDGG